MSSDSDYLRRAIRLAMNGRGGVEPNPMVGCVIVKQDRIIGESFHERFGGPHAEPRALASCSESPAGATAYVTLEPCCHLEKKTPPCAPRLIDAKIARVVIGCMDPNPAVNGKGVQMLRDGGIRVDGPLLEKECQQLIAPFLAGVQQLRPYVTLKWAQSADGKVAGAQGRPVKLSGEKSWQLVHQLRARSDAILIGSGTAVADDPLLTPRRVKKGRKPLRVVLDSHLRIAPESRLVETAGEWPVLIFTTTAQGRSRKAKALGKAGAEVIGAGEERVKLAEVMSELHRRGVTHLMVEPGPTLAGAMFAAGLADRVWVFHSPKKIADGTAPAAVDVPSDYVRVGKMEVGEDRLEEYLNPGSAVFFSAEASADFVLGEGN